MGLEQSNATVLWTVAQPRLDGADSIRGTEGPEVTSPITHPARIPRPRVPSPAPQGSQGHEAHHPYKDPGLAVRGCCRDRPPGRSAAVWSGRVRRTHAVGGHICPPYEDGVLIEHPVGDGFQPSRQPSDDRRSPMERTSTDTGTVQREQAPTLRRCAIIEHAVGAVHRAALALHHSHIER